MKIHITINSALTFLILGVPGLLSAQTDPLSSVDRLSPGDVVRVQAPGVSVAGGAVTEIDDETLYVMDEGQEWLIDIPAIERLERQQRTVGKNVLVFGSIGALAGFAAGKFNEDLSMLPFAVGGVAVGLAFGMTNREWRLIYPR